MAKKIFCLNDSTNCKQRESPEFSEMNPQQCHLYPWSTWPVQSSNFNDPINFLLSRDSRIVKMGEIFNERQ